MALHLIPAPCDGRARIMRIFFGKLRELPSRPSPAAPLARAHAPGPGGGQPGFK